MAESCADDAGDERDDRAVDEGFGVNPTADGEVPRECQCTEEANDHHQAVTKNGRGRIKPRRQVVANYQQKARNDERAPVWFLAYQRVHEHARRHDRQQKHESEDDKIGDSKEFLQHQSISEKSGRAKLR